MLTEDFLYIKTNEVETKKKAPEYCSVFALIQVLCEKQELAFDQYLDFFAYLSSYRFRFLPITVNDIEKAVFGSGPIKTVRPERIRQFNFQLTLSEEYGVPFEQAFLVVGSFFTKVLLDDAILPEMTERIFVEILSTFPADKDKKTLGNLFLQTSVQTINRIRDRIIIGVRVQEKIDRLLQLNQVF